MGSPEFCRRQAAAVFRMAQSAQSARERYRFLGQAQCWLELAEHGRRLEEWNSSHEISGTFPPAR